MNIKHTAQWSDEFLALTIFQTLKFLKIMMLHKKYLEALVLGTYWRSKKSKYAFEEKCEV